MAGLSFRKVEPPSLPYQDLTTKLRRCIAKLPYLFTNCVCFMTFCCWVLAWVCNYCSNTVSEIVTWLSSTKLLLLILFLVGSRVFSMVHYFFVYLCVCMCVHPCILCNWTRGNFQVLCVWIIHFCVLFDLSNCK